LSVKFRIGNEKRSGRKPSQPRRRQRSTGEGKLPRCFHFHVWSIGCEKRGEKSKRKNERSRRHGNGSAPSGLNRKLEKRVYKPQHEKGPDRKKKRKGKDFDLASTIGKGRGGRRKDGGAS